MIITIGTFETEVERFTLSVNARDEGKRSNRLDLELADKTLNLDSASELIETELAENDIVITNGTNTYTYTDYEFEGISRQVDTSYDRINLTFKK